MQNLDRRVQRTRAKLAEACIDLMLEIGFDRISVRDLTRRAGVGSSTFYRHFQDKDDMLTCVSLEAAQALRDAVAPAQSPREEAVLLFKFARQNPKIILLYVSLPPDSRARQATRLILADMVRERFRPRESSIVDPNIAINHICVAYSELVVWYLDNQDKYSPEEIAEICGDLVVRAAVEVAFEPREDWLQRFSHASSIPAPDPERRSVPQTPYEVS